MPEPMTAPPRLQELAQRIDRELARLLPAANAAPPRVHEAMRYSVLGGGKRIRPSLCLLGCEAAGGALEKALPAACALELIHAYSLIHDDLPAMDDDDLRRGRPSCHRAFDEATAILAGDALLTEAFSLIAQSYANQPALVTELVRLIAKAAGSKGMVGGQVLDMAAMAAPPEPEALLSTLEEIHRRKTGALLLGSLLAGAAVAEADSATTDALDTYGRAIGLAFQVVDDILDATRSEGELGKTPGKDEAQGKLTYVAALGLEGARAFARELGARGRAAIACLGPAAAALDELAGFIVQRAS